MLLVVEHMARRRRVFIPGTCVHVTQRGNNRQAIFGDDDDRAIFLALTADAASLCGVDVHAFVLMPNHYHLLVTPTSATALPRMVQRFGGCYVQYFNRRYRRTGTLWDGRYGGANICDARYFYSCLRYLEQNPVRAGLVMAPEAYRWSSYRVHAFGEPSAWLVLHPLYLALGPTPATRQAVYRALGERISDAVYDGV
jgi:REP-associated tyrosine transposase